MMHLGTAALLESPPQRKARIYQNRHTQQWHASIPMKEGGSSVTRGFRHFESAAAFLWVRIDMERLQRGQE